MRIGLLIIGSLYWDPSPVRKRWRQARFGCGGQHRVKIPIRYGRRSNKRGGTFSMVFAMSCSPPESQGCGLVVPARAECCEPDHLIEEASQLWAAERDCSRVGGISADWGRVCVLPDPDARGVEGLLHAWQEKVQGVGSAYRAVPAADGEEQVLEAATGLARFRWPLDVDTAEPLAGFDLLLMTATEPTLVRGTYSPASEIARSWREDKKDNVSYFHNNRHHGITTFEDEEILRILRGEPPNKAMQPPART